MPLTSDEIAVTSEIVRESYSDVAAAAGSLNTAQELLLVDDIATWELIRDSHVKLTGEVDFDNGRKRAGIFHRVRNMLGFDPMPYDPDAQVLELLELEVGGNFG